MKKLPNNINETDFDYLSDGEYKVTERFHKGIWVQEIFWNNQNIKAGTSFKVKDNQFHTDYNVPSYKTKSHSVWHKCNLLHRDDDKPAYIIIHDSQSWYINGKRHRDYGPAFIRVYASFDEAYFINDVNITRKVNAWINENDFPHWEKWTDEHKILFKLKFGE